LGILAAIFQVRDCIPAQSGHIGELAEAETTALPQGAQVGETM
jgi:hypothetical protein